MSDTMDENVTILSAIKEMQRTLNSQQTLMLQLFRNSERIERRVDGFDRRFGDIDRRIDETNVRLTEMKEEFSLILKMELGGALTHFETRLDARLERIEDRLENIERKRP